MTHLVLSEQRFSSLSLKLAKRDTRDTRDTTQVFIAMKVPLCMAMYDVEIRILLNLKFIMTTFN